MAVIGTGTMGRAIAKLLARQGHDVRVHDARTATVPEGVNVVACDDLASCVQGADLVIEAIIEKLEAKRALLAEIQNLVGPVPLASNTSTFRPSQLAEGLPHPEAVLVAHFFNPADVVPLVELVPSPTTSDSALSLVRDLLTDADKVVVSLDREVDGFVANRLQAALVREALWLVREGVATAEDVDAAVIHGLGPRWALAGPFEVLDRGGLDVWAAVTSRLFPVLSNELTTPEEITRRLARGDLGLKSGRGFHDYHDGTGSPFNQLEAVLSARIPTDASS